MLRYRRFVRLSAEFDLGAEARCRHAHLDCSLAHTVKSIATCLGWWTLVDEIAKHRCGRKDGEVYIVERLCSISQNGPGYR